MEDQLPKIGKEWVMRKDAGAQGSHSWVNFENQGRSGEVLSFVAWKVPASFNASSGAIGQASIGTFSSNGSALFGATERGQSIHDMVRHRIVSINLTSDNVDRDIDAIEYTYIFDSDGDSKATMAHGYCFVAGTTAFFVRHTSSRPIKSKLAHDMACALLSKHFKLDDKPHSVGKVTIKESHL